MTSNRSKEWYSIATAIPCPACGFKVVFDGLDQALSKQRAELIEKVEGMKKPEKTCYTTFHGVGLSIIDSNYNQALDDVLQLLKGEE